MLANESIPLHVIHSRAVTSGQPCKCGCGLNADKPVRVHPDDLYIGVGNSVTVFLEGRDHTFSVSGQTREMVEVIVRENPDSPRSYRLFPKMDVLAVNGEQVYVSTLIPRVES